MALETHQGFSCSVAQSCLALCDPVDCSMPGFTVHHQLLELTQTHVHLSPLPSNHLILCHPLLFLPSIFPSIRVFFNESVLCIRWPKYWSFSFSISPSNEHPGLISFRIDWFDLAGIYSIDYKHSLVWKIGRETNKTKQEQNLLMWTFLDSLIIQIITDHLPGVRPVHSIS